MIYIMKRIMNFRNLFYLLIKILFISIMVWLGTIMLRINYCNMPPIVLLFLLLIINLLFFIVFYKNYYDFISKYSCVLAGVVIGLMIKNNEMYILYITLKSSSVFTIINKMILNFKMLNIDEINKYYSYCLIIFVISVLIMLSLSYFVKIFVKNKKNNLKLNNNKCIDTLFEERKKYIDLLNDYMINNEVYGIGIDGEYGSGKSFLLDTFININKKNFEVIRIFSISANDDKIEEYLLEQLKNVMNKNYVFSSGVDEIIRYFDKIKIIDLFNEKSTYYEKYLDIKEKILLVGKKIIFVIDDLDRVQSIDKICKIFNILELLRCEHIKCFYLYDIEVLAEKFNKNIEQKKDVEEGERIGKYTHLYNYIRKYIDREILLTSVNDYKNACFKLFNDEQVNNLVNERVRINDTLKSIQKYSKSFDDYCRFVPRILNELLVEYFNIIKCERYSELINDNLKVPILEGLIFKYYFEKSYIKFVKNNDTFEKFLDKEYNVSKNNINILNDAINLSFFDCSNQFILQPNNDQEVLISENAHNCSKELNEILKEYSQNEDFYKKLNKCVFLLVLFNYSKEDFDRFYVTRPYYTFKIDNENCKKINKALKIIRGEI